MKLTKNYFKLSNNIFELGLKPTEFVVLSYIARCSNNNAQAFPSYNKISEKCNIGLSTSKKVVKDLVKMGLITKESRLINDNKSCNSNAYSLTEKVLVKSTKEELETKESVEDVVVEETTEESTNDVVEYVDVHSNDYEESMKVALVEDILEDKPNNKILALLKKIREQEVLSVVDYVYDNKKTEKVTYSYLIGAIYKLFPNLKSCY